MNADNTPPTSDKLVSPNKAIGGLGAASFFLLTTTTGWLFTLGATGLAVTAVVGALYAWRQASSHREARNGLLLLVLMLICTALLTPFGIVMTERHPEYLGWVSRVFGREGVAQGNTPPASSPSSAPSTVVAPRPPPSVEVNSSIAPTMLRFSKGTALAVIGGSHPNDAKIAAALSQRLASSGFNIVADPTRAAAIVQVSFVKATDPQLDGAGRWVEYLSTAVIRASARWKDKSGNFFGATDVERTGRSARFEEASIAAQSEVVQVIVDQLIALADK